LKIFIPKEVKETIARENAKLLMQAQEDLGLLNGQMVAGEEGTRKQVQLYEAQQVQQTQQAQQAPPAYGQPVYVQLPDRQPATHPMHYIPPVPLEYQVPQQGYQPQYQQGPQQEHRTAEEPRDARGECIIS
jgi:hypothetical protein